ncbi:hypothetical protein PR048_006124 [Dryococelus australis]|uniref:Uncharacterized protein n=1 Tax=Dryococelus australis TaxID=614101 RepID=A0ABQ9IB24_9NEOP|nr:hypothetical protein PR048_006124 [Dryococelus australis]
MHLFLFESGSSGITNMSIKVLTALHYIARAWSEDEVGTIQNCFEKNSFPVTKTDVILEEHKVISAEWDALRVGSSFEEFINNDADVMKSEVQKIWVSVTKHNDKVTMNRKMKRRERNHHHPLTQKQMNH